MVKSRKPGRIDPTPSVLKKLFALSGNLCAMPDCENALIHKTGTMVGKVAHIHAAEKGGARFLATMTDEDRRSIENLFIVCGICHDVVDDPKNEKKFPAEKLKKIKKTHEDNLRRAELQFITKYSDQTQISKPKYPQTLRRLADVMDWPDVLNSADHIKGICEFVRNLSELPLEQRQFALTLAKRLRRRDLNELPTNDVEKAFGIGRSKVKEQMELLEHHKLGSVEETFMPGQFVVKLWDRDWGGNPWIEILDFCEKSGNQPDEFIVDLNFALYD